MDKMIPKTIQAYEYVKSGLKTGKWLFGDELLVMDISKEMNFSRRPVIDALKKLEMERFVEIIPQTGCRVVNCTKEQMVNHFQIGMCLEGLAAGLAARRREDTEVQELIAINESLKSIITTTPFSYEHYFAENRKLHEAILRMAGSEELLQFTKSMWDLNDFYLVNSFQFKTHLAQSISEHDVIIAKIKNKDEKGARFAMEEHIIEFAGLFNDR